MKISIRENDGIAVVSVQGNIMQEYVSVFRSRIGDLIERGTVRIVLNLADSSYMSSMCLAAIVEAKNRTVQAGGDIRVTCANMLIENLLEITNLNKKIEMFPTVDDAVASFGK